MVDHDLMPSILLTKGLDKMSNILYDLNPPQNHGYYMNMKAIVNVVFGFFIQIYHLNHPHGINP